MNCPKCGIEVEEGIKFCASCGANLQAEPAAEKPAAEPKPAPKAAPVTPPPTYYAPQPVYSAPVKPTIPEEYTPVSAWGYFWYNILFSIPVVGFIFLLVFSLSNGNLNRRNYARSYFCALLVAAIIAIIVLLISLILTVVAGISLNEVVYMS